MDYAGGSTGSAATDAGRDGAQDTMLARRPIGQITEISGSASQCRLDAKLIAELEHALDPCLSMGGQVGSQVKVKVGGV